MPATCSDTENGHSQSVMQCSSRAEWLFYVPRLEMGPPFVRGHPSNGKIKSFADFKAKIA